MSHFEYPPMQILIADDDPDFRELLKKRCETMGLEVLTSGDAMDALSNIDFYGPEIVLLDVRMPGGNGISVAEMLATQSRMNEAQVIIMTASSNDLIAQRCQAMNATLILKDDSFWPVLSQRLEAIRSNPSPHPEPGSHHKSPRRMLCDPAEPSLASPKCYAEVEIGSTNVALEDSETARVDSGFPAESESPWVMTIDDDPDVMIAIQKRLESCGIAMRHYDRGMDGYREAVSGRLAAVLLDYQMPDGDGEYTLRRLRESELTRDVPVIVVTGQRDAALKRRMLAAGASAFLNKPVSWEELRQSLSMYTDLDLHQRPNKTDRRSTPRARTERVTTT
ncbi:MAG: response regulator, partial [Planctomycetota bacterium]